MSARKARAIFVELVAQVPPEQWEERLAVLAVPVVQQRDKPQGSANRRTLAPFGRIPPAPFEQRLRLSIIAARRDQPERPVPERP